MKRIILTVVFVSLLFCTKQISAADYVFESGNNNNYFDAQKINLSGKPIYVYGSMSAGFGKVDFYIFEPADYIQQTEISLLVPSTGNVQYYKPSLVFLEPYIQQFSGNVPFNLPSDMGGKEYKWEEFEEKQVANDTISESLIRGPTLTKSLSPLRYYIAVYDPNSQAGSYVLKIGTGEEPFSWLNLPKLALAFIRIKLHIY